MSRISYAPPLDRLRRYGEPKVDDQWTSFRPNYVKELALGPEHVAALIDVAREWTKTWDEAAGAATWAPVHAWRALGQLRAAEAIQPLLALLKPLEEAGDDWFYQDLPDLLGMIGAAAVPPLRAYVSDIANGPLPREAAVDGLTSVALHHPESREEVLRYFMEVLAQCESNDPEVNALIICGLMSLKATEAAELIERAFAADCVEEFIVCWDDVRSELGVPGVGLITEEPEEDGPSSLTGLLQREGFDRPVDRPSLSRKKKNVKAKRKQSSSSRRRNRRR